MEGEWEEVTWTWRGKVGQSKGSYCTDWEERKNENNKKDQEREGRRTGVGGNKEGRKEVNK